MFRTGYEFLSNSCACTCMCIAVETVSVPEINICDIEIEKIAFLGEQMCLIP